MPSALPIIGIACDVITAGLHQFHGAVSYTHLTLPTNREV